MSNLKYDLLAAIGRLENGEQLAGNELAPLVSAIAALEVEEGGPYAQGGQNVDVGLNLLIAYFLLLCEVELVKLNDFLLLNFAPMANRGPAVAGENSVFLTAEEFKHFSERWQNLRGQKKDQPAVENTNVPDEAEMMDKIMRAAMKRFGGLPDEFKNLALDGIKKTTARNHDKQMSLMAYFMREALGNKASQISEEMIVDLGLANIFFWTAFIIYDDFWDEDEAAEPRILPTANLFARSYVDYFCTLLPESTGFRAFFHKVMDELDGANTWENIHCRAKIEGTKFIVPDQLPDYGEYENKFRPASGHILGPVAMMVQLGYSVESPEVKNLVAYFRNYLIAMQINDDSHDWEEDLRRGHISTVVAMLLQDLNWPTKEIDLEKDLSELKKVFWFKTIAKAARLAVGYTEKSRQALQSLAILENPAPLEKFILISENVAKKALKEQRDSVNFLESWS